MNGRKNNTPWIVSLIVGLILWAILLPVRASGGISTPVFRLMSLVAWLPLLADICIFLVTVIENQIAKLKRWHRRRKTDRRIIAQAKAAGVWDKEPLVLGGRALELKAWKDFKIKRKPNETDSHLRVRCNTTAYKSKHTKRGREHK